MRLFTAIEIGTEALQEIERVWKALREHISCQRWQPLKNMHLTLQFLGEVEESKTESLESSLAMVCKRFSPFRLELGGIGAFPHLERASVLWLGLGGELDRLSALEAAMRRELKALGLVAEGRRYSPHITLARKPQDTRQVAAVVEQLQIKRTSWRVERVLLFRSQLHPAGAIHTIIGEYPLP